MRSTATKLLVLVFTALVIACPFEVSGVSDSHASSSPEDGTFCGILHSSIAGPVPLEQPAFLFPTENPLAPVPKGDSLWSLVQSIDHPPEPAI